MHFDWLLLFSMTLICCIGLIVIYSAGYDVETDSSRAMVKQAISFGIGIGLTIVCLFISPTFWRRISWPFFIFGCTLLLYVMFKGVVAGGARRWIDFGGFRMQPAEFTKLGIILVLARLFSSDKAPRDGYTIRTLLFPVAIIFLPSIIIMKQPDLGTALCHILIGSSMLLMAGIQKKTLLRIFLSGAILAVPAWSMLKDYQKKRVLNFLSPEMDPLGSGYHAIQSKIAVGSGAVYGKGFLKGTQTQLRFLPEQTTDFIFSVLAEEWGFIGSVVVICLYALLIMRLLNVCSKCNDSFTAFVSYGVASMMFWHVCINIGMVIGVMPVVGVTLKLFSYGGSSLIAAMAGIGIVLSFTLRRYSFA
ncbi:MAG: rod shape-determining protein RodA [Proteobacteria bacterium]|nr:rod shape-determining protein RodA [Pseudomonadota bacterium]